MLSFLSEDYIRKRQLFMTMFVELDGYPKADGEILTLVSCGVTGLEWSVRALKSSLLAGERSPP